MEQNKTTKNKLTVLDSNIWIARLDKKDSQHEKALNLFKNLKSKICLPEYIMSEASTVLSQNVSKKSADDFIEKSIFNDEIELLVFNEFDFQKILKTFLKIKNEKLSFVDISLVFLSNEYEIKTFDKELSKEIENH